MAGNVKRRVDSGSERKTKYNYEDGNAARKLDSVSQKEHKKESVSKTTTKNRAKAQKIGKGYVLFLAAVSAASVFMCVEYLQMKAVITSQNKKITTLESNLNDLKSDNDAYYNKVLTSVNVEFIKNVAMNQLGMAYPNEEQIYVFDTDGDSYVRQYENIPGVK